MRAILAPLGVCAVVVALLAGGCGSSEPEIDVPTRAEATEQLAGAPAALAGLHRQAGELLDGGQDAFERRLAALHGHPVVVNAWASWCGPCVLEFPWFQRLAVGYGKRVAFVGVDVDDPPAEAQAFLRDHFVAYPSYVDRGKKIARAIGASVGLPTTVFYDRDGEVAYVHQGPYREEADLEADIRRYLLTS